MPRFGTHISIDQLGYPRATIRDVVALIKSLNRDAALVILGTYNLTLSLASTKNWDGEEAGQRLEAQAALMRNSISAKRLRELKHHFGNGSLVDRPLFHRAQLLSMIKLVAKFSDSASGNRLEKRDDFDAIGELGLLVNSLFAEGRPQGDVGDAIAPGLAASMELENPPTVAESMIRADGMLSRHLAAMGVHDRFARYVEQLFLFSTSLNFEELLDLTFAVWAYYRSLTVQQLIDRQGAAHFNPLSPGNVASGKRLGAVLGAYSIPFGEVAGLSFGDAEDRSFLVNHTAIRDKPIWRFGEDNFLCVDPAFLQERLSAGVYWTIINALDHDDGVEFARLWGRLFERYVWEVLESIFPAGSVYRSLHYADSGDEAFDAAIDYGEHLIVIQTKSTFAPVAAKYSNDSTRFFDGMESRYGDAPHAALRQIRENLMRSFGAEGRRVISQLRGRKFKHVLPIILYQEPILRFGLVTRRFTKRLEDAFADVLFQLDVHVRPVVFMHVDDLHLAAQYIRDGDITLVEALQEKLAADRDHIHSFDSFWKEVLRPRRRLAGKDDRAAAQAWEHYRDAALARFHAGQYL
jgi:hypothetical protein